MGSSKTWTIILAIILIFLWIKYSSLKEKNEQLSDLVAEYQYALEQANENIEGANSIIEDAQGYAWSSYEDMGYALENLYTVDTIFDPGRSSFFIPGLSFPKAPLIKVPMLPHIDIPGF